LDIADREALAQAMAVVSRGCPSHDAASRLEKRLVAERIRSVHLMHLERHEAVRDAGCELSLERLPPYERTLVHAYEAIEARLERRVIGRQIGAPHAIGFLHAKRFHRAHPDHADAVLAPAGEKR